MTSLQTSIAVNTDVRQKKKEEKIENSRCFVSVLLAILFAGFRTCTLLCIDLRIVASVLTTLDNGHLPGENYSMK
jgi:hypothetical protein